VLFTKTITIASWYQTTYVDNFACVKQYKTKYFHEKKVCEDYFDQFDALGV